MDKIILNREQLQALKSFIASRSQRFQDPVVMLEILDHFGCKVEELLTAEPKMDFETAMQKAHRSFGVLGFGPIADHVESGITNKYRHFGRKQAIAFFRSFHLIGAIAIGIAAYKLMYFLQVNYPVWQPFGYLFLGAQVCHVAFVGLMRHRRTKLIGQHAIYESAAMRADRSFLYYVPFIFPFFNSAHMNPIAASIIFAVFVCLAVMSIHTHIALGKKITEDIQSIDKQMASTL